MRPSEVATDPLRLSLVTVGDPDQPTGGYRYHRVMAEAAPNHGTQISFASIHGMGLAAGSATAGPIVRAATDRSDAILLDSIAAAASAPWLGRVRAPIVAVVHQRPGGVGRHGSRSRIRAALDRSAYRRATGAVVAAQSLADDLVRSGVSGERIRLVEPGCDITAAGLPLELRRGRAAAVLCVANWSSTKGILELLDAFATLPDQAATLWLLGAAGSDRRYAARVRRRISMPDLSHRVVATGALPIEQVGRFYRSADVFAMCSTVDAYGTAWAEALSAGLPVVGWRTANLPRLARDGREGLIPELGDARGLAEALRTVTMDTGVRERLACGARERAGTLPTWRDSAERFFVAVRGLLGA